MIRFLCCGNWARSDVSLAWVPGSRKRIAEVESAVDHAWSAALAKPGIHLFDGPMCRLESWQTVGNTLNLFLSESSYKLFMGTNMSHPEFATLHGSQVMANPIGVSPALLTVDRYLLLGRRNSTVAYYPERVHPFSGCLEPKDTDLFSAVARELSEELSLGSADISDIRCMGIAEDQKLVQPELIFTVETSKTKSQMDAQLDRDEHQSIFAIPATVDAIEEAVQDPQLTPVAVAALLLWGRANIGQNWFEKVRPA